MRRARKAIATMATPLPLGGETVDDCEVSPRNETATVEDDDPAAAAPRASVFVRAASTLAARASRVMALPRAKPKEAAIEETESEDDRESIETTALQPVLPWQTRNESGDVVDDLDLRQRILELTVFRSTFVDHPGGEDEYLFDYARHTEIAKALLLCDPNLREMHASLIPSAVDDVAFWRHFFLRCNALRLALERPPYLPKSTYSSYTAVASLQKLKRELYLRRRSSTERLRRTILRPRTTSSDLLVSTDAQDVALGHLDLDLDGEIDRELRKRRPSRAVARHA